MKAPKQLAYSGNLAEHSDISLQTEKKAAKAVAQKKIQ